MRHRLTLAAWRHPCRRACVRAYCMVRVRNVHVRCQARAGHAHGGLCGARERVSMHVRDLACICRTPRSRGGSRSRLAGGRRRCTMARSSWDATHRPHSREGSTRHGNRAQRAASGRPLPRAAQRRRSANSCTAHYLAFAKFRQLGASSRKRGQIRRADSLSYTPNKATTPTNSA